MTLFETFPHFTLFVLFFMLGLATRFVAQFLTFIFGTLGVKIERQILSFQKKKKHDATKKTYFSKLKLKLDSKFCKKTLEEKANACPKQRRKIDWRNVLFQIFVVLKNIAECVFEIAYFFALGIITLWIFNLFEFVEFYWFIPLSVVGGAMTNIYLTKELFAKK